MPIYGEEILLDLLIGHRHEFRNVTLRHHWDSVQLQRSYRPGLPVILRQPA